jgi:hypothetical protein
MFGHNSWKKYQKQFKVKSGDILYLNRLDDSTIFSAIRVNNPSATINGSGTLGPDGKRLSMYHMGFILHPFEKEMIQEMLIVHGFLLAAMIDEFREEVLGKTAGTMKTSSAALGCTVCQRSEQVGGGRLLVCNGCHAVVYCSKKCQKSHWKAHKKMCQRMQQQPQAATSPSSQAAPPPDTQAMDSPQDPITPQVPVANIINAMSDP